MKKYSFMGLDIELTRRCNMHCKHCVRGEAQNITITKDIIDRIFEDVLDCASLYISGGEPLLEPDILLYLLNRVRSWTGLISLEITTNGSVLDERVVYALEDLCKAPIHSIYKDNDEGRDVILTISNDEYHVSGELQKALNFYSPLFEEANKRLEGTGSKMELRTWSPVNEEEARSKRDMPATLIYAGRAKDLADESINKGVIVRLPPSNNHRLKITGNLVYCRTLITSKGDIVVATEDDSYASYDACAVGNIMDRSLSDIIDDHQNNCVISCNESRYVDIKNQLNLNLQLMGKSEIPDVLVLKISLLYEINSSILKLRKILKGTYPILPAQDLIGELPMVLDDGNLDVLVLRIISNTHWTVRERLENKVCELEANYADLINSDTAQAVRNYCKAITYMQDNGLSLIMKLRKQEMQVLIDKVKAYSDGKTEPDNSGVFACGNTGIFANKNDVDEEYVNERISADYYRVMQEFNKNRIWKT